MIEAQPFAIALRNVFLEPFRREHLGDPCEPSQAIDQRHAHPVVADQRPGVGEELVGHVDPAGGDPELGEVPLGVGDFLERRPCRNGSL